MKCVLGELRMKSKLMTEFIPHLVAILLFAAIAPSGELWRFRFENRTQNLQISDLCITYQFILLPQMYKNSSGEN